jgi:tetratricopeptide (TPR) repeat protein
MPQSEFGHSRSAITRSGLWKELLVQTELLLEQQAWLIVVRNVRVALGQGRSVSAFESLLGLLEGYPRDWLNFEDGRVLFADVMLRCRRFKLALEMIELWHTEDGAMRDDAALAALYSLALLNCGQPVRALEVSRSLSDGRLEGVGLAWRVRANCLQVLGQPGWDAAFAQASEQLVDRALGICLLEWGKALEMAAEHGPARDRWAQALGLFDGDAYYRASLTFNLGLSCARELLLEQAERHFANLRAIARNPDAKMFEARAWCGYGLVWRIAGEFQRAEHAYRRASNLASEPDDLQQAWRGLGHTLRLAGQVSAALEALQRATQLQANPDGTNWAFVDLAVARWVNSDGRGTLEALDRVGTLRGEDHDRRQILLAEMARVNGDANRALDLLEPLRLERLWVAEELTFFTELKQLLNVMGATTPADLPRSKGMQVEVQAGGVLRVKLNGRRVALSPTSKAAQVLVLLLEHDQAMGVESLVLALFGDKQDELASKRKLVSKAVRVLRDALGWPASVQESGGTYSLDDRAAWRYDVHTAISRGELVAQFMVGVYADWALERAAQLRADDRILN